MPGRMDLIRCGFAAAAFFIVLCTLPRPAGAVRIIDDTTVVIYWTAPGDDNNSGTAAIYDLRYLESPPASDTSAWWNNAVRIDGEPSPSPAGFTDSCIVRGASIFELNYFALETFDESGNSSGLSNIALFPILDCADINGDGRFNLADATYLLAFIYGGGPDPVGSRGDVDNSGIVNLLDTTLLLKYLYQEGPPPPCPGNR